MNSSRVKFNTSKELASAFNFGPALEANQSVQVLIEATLSHWPGNWQDLSDPTAPHEAGRLHLQTVAWYRTVHKGASPLECCLQDLEVYEGKRMIFTT